MKTRKQCFDEARQLFCQHNSGIVEQIKNQAAVHAEALGLSEAEFIKEEINKAFGHFVNGLGADSTSKIIEMMAPDEATKKALLLEHYQEISDALGLPLDAYLKENHIAL